MKSSKTILSVTLFTLAVDLSAQTLTVLHAFGNAPDGANPRSGVIWDGHMLYGTAYSGGTNGNGTIFRLSLDGLSYTNIKVFTGSPADGRTPQRGLLMVSNILYGTTYYGGSNGYGVVFQINPDGSGYSILKHFHKSPDAENPSCNLIYSSNTLYGTTQLGGSNGYGAVFKLELNGSNYMVLRSFTNTPDGAYPQAGLVLGGNTLYGTTYSGGTNGYGTVFKINTDGLGYTELKSFANAPDGATPYGSLVLSGDTLYGTTAGGGTNYGGTIFKINTDGSGYALLRHCSAATGSDPWGGLTLNGNTLYGTTTAGGVMPNNFGTVFKINIDGSGYAVLAGFDQTNGGNPDLAGVIWVSNTLYGTTYLYGTNFNGVVFSLTTPPLPPLQISNAASPRVYWADDGFNRVLQTTTNLASGSWSNVTRLNYTNNPDIGLTITNPAQPPQSYFRLE